MMGPGLDGSDALAIELHRQNVDYKMNNINRKAQIWDAIAFK